MSLAQIQQIYDEQVRLGLTFGVVFKMPPPKGWASRKSWNRVKTPFGLCKVIGSDSRSLHILVKLEQLEKFIKRYRTYIENLFDNPCGGGE